jgi:hypothetical protein
VDRMGSACSMQRVEEGEGYAHRIRHVDLVAAPIGINFADKKRSLGQYS